MIVTIFDEIVKSATFIYKLGLLRKLRKMDVFNEK